MTSKQRHKTRGIKFPWVRTDNFKHNKVDKVDAKDIYIFLIYLFVCLFGRELDRIMEERKLKLINLIQQILKMYIGMFSTDVC